MRKEYPQMRDVLERTWKLLEKAPVKIPDDLKTAYKKVMTPDGHDWQPKKGVKYTWAPSFRPRRRSRRQRRRRT
jgi:hypothetical protein